MYNILYNIYNHYIELNSTFDFSTLVKVVLGSAFPYLGCFGLADSATIYTTIFIV